MNKKHSALTLVIALSLLAFAFALPKASFANVPEGAVIVDGYLEDGHNGRIAKVLEKEEYDKYIPVANDFADKFYKEEAEKIIPSWFDSDPYCFRFAFRDSGIENACYITEDGDVSKTLEDVGNDRFYSYYNHLWIDFDKNIPEEISQYFDFDDRYDLYGIFDVAWFDKSMANPMEEYVKTDDYKRFLLLRYVCDKSEGIGWHEAARMDEKIKAAGYEPVLTLVDTNFEGKEAGDLLYKVTYEKVSDNKPADKPVVEVKDNDVMKIENKDFKLGTDKTIAVEIQKDFDTFGKDVKVYVDGKLVAPENYTVTKGSIIITFKESFLKTLGEGKHEFKTVFSDNTETNTEFNVVAAGEKVDTTPKSDAKTTKPAPKKDVVPQTSDVYSTVTVLMTAVSGAAALKASRKF